MAVLNPILKRKDVLPWWKCPSDRELALRAKIKVGYSTIAGRANVNKYAPIIGTASVRGLSVEELDIIEDVVARSARIEKMNEMRNSSLILQYDELKKNCEGDGVSTCILCGYDFNQPHNNERASYCHVCSKIVCLRCKYEEKEFGDLICLCPVCFEEKELWRKTGAWLMNALPPQTFNKKQLEDLINKTTENKQRKASLEISGVALGEKIRMTETEESMLEEDIEELAKDATMNSFNNLTFQDRDDSSRPPSRASTPGWDNLDELRKSSSCVEDMIIAQDRRASSSHRQRSSVILDKPGRPSSATTPSIDPTPSPPPSPPHFGIRRSFAMSPSQRQELAKYKPGAKLLHQNQISTDSEDKTSHSPYPDSDSSLEVGGDLLVIRQSLDESSNVPLILVSEPSIHIEDNSGHYGDGVSEQNNKEEEGPQRLKRKNATRRSKRKSINKDNDIVTEDKSDLSFSRKNPFLPNDTSELKYPGRQNQQEPEDLTGEPHSTTSELTITVNEQEDNSMNESISMPELMFPLKEPEDTSELMFPVIPVKKPEDTSELMFPVKEPEDTSELVFPVIPVKEPEDTSELMFPVIPVKEPEDTSELMFPVIPVKEPEDTSELMFPVIPVKEPEDTSKLMFPVKEPEDTSELLFPVIPVKEPEDTSELMFPEIPVKEPEDTSELMFPEIPVKEPEDTSELMFPVIPVKKPEDTSELMFPVKEPEDTSELMFPEIPVKEPEDTSELMFPVIPVKKPEDTSELMFPVKEPEDTSELMFPVIPVKEPEDTSVLMFPVIPVKEPEDTSELMFPVIPVKEPEDKQKQKELSELTSPVNELKEISDLTYPVKELENKTEVGFTSEEKETTPTPTPPIKPRRRTLVVKATEHTDPPSHEDHSNTAQKQDGGYSWKRRNATRSGGKKGDRNSTASTSEADISSGSVSGDDTLKRKREKARLAARRLRNQGGVSESRRKRNDDNDPQSPDIDGPQSPDNDGPRSPERLI